MPGLCIHCREPIAHVTNEGGAWASTLSMSLACPPSPDGRHHSSEEEKPVTTEQHNLHMAAPESEKVPSMSDLQKMIEAAVQGRGAQQSQTFEEALSQVDPADSDAALAMLDFLLKTGRLGRVGVLDGGQGYLFMYSEPKGATKQGYKPGATQGDRIVDGALESQRASGNGVPASEKGMCPNCLSVVRKEGDQIVDDETGSAECSSPDGKHAVV